MTLEELREENDLLREQVAQLKAMLLPRGWEPSAELKLTRREAPILALLYNQDGIVSKDRLVDFLYGLSSDADIPEAHIIRVFIHRIRKKLQVFGATVDTVWGRGYTLSPESRAILEGMNANKGPTISLQA